MTNENDEFLDVGDAVTRRLTGIGMHRNLGAELRTAWYHKCDDLEPLVTRASSVGCFA